MSEWTDEFWQFAKPMVALDRAIYEYVNDLSDKDVARLRVLADRPTATNCFWAIYRVAPLVAEECRRVQSRRAHIAADVAAAEAQVAP